MGDPVKTSDSSSQGVSVSGLDDSQAWAQLTGKYLRELPQQLDGIKANLEIKDYDAIKKRAHRIKGTSGTYHLDSISKSAAQLERSADRQDSDAIVSTIQKVKRFIEQENNKLDSGTGSPYKALERKING